MISYEKTDQSSIDGSVVTEAVYSEKIVPIYEDMYESE